MASDRGVRDTLTGTGVILLTVAIAGPIGLLVRILRAGGDDAWTIVAVRNIFYTAVVTVICVVRWRGDVHAQLIRLDGATVLASFFLATQV